MRIYCDNGFEFISKELDRWAYKNGVILGFLGQENLQKILM
jgi:hypothetical protein